MGKDATSNSSKIYFKVFYTSKQRFYMKMRYICFISARKTCVSVFYAKTDDEHFAFSDERSLKSIKRFIKLIKYLYNLRTRKENALQQVAICYIQSAYI
jgi:hypothetical protein